MIKEYLESLGKNIRYKKEYVGNDTYRLYIKKNEIELLEKYLTKLESIDSAKPSEDLKTIDEIRTEHTKYHTNGIASGTIEIEQDYFFSLIHIAKSNVEKLKQIEEAKKINPNEQALDCLQKLKVIHHLNAQVFPKSYEYCNIIKDALTYKTKKEEAWDIAVKKNVDIIMVRSSRTFEEYNFKVNSSNLNRKELTEDEFNLFKEVIE